MGAAILKQQFESVLGGQIDWQSKPLPETARTGIAEIDSVIGGLARGCLTEIYGPASSGRTSLLISILAEATGRQEVCALVDADDAFDPVSAAAAGVRLDKLIWVRAAKSAEQALKAADLLIQGGGFGLVAVDLGNVPPKLGRRVPLASWFRFRRVVEHTPTILVFLEREPYAKTCATLVLRVESGTACWTDSGVRDSGFGVRSKTGNWKLETGNSIFESGNWKLETRNSKPEIRKGTSKVSHACLLHGLRPKVEVVRSRLPNTVTSVVHGQLSFAEEQPSAISHHLSAASGPAISRQRVSSEHKSLALADS